MIKLRPTYTKNRPKKTGKRGKNTRKRKQKVAAFSRLRYFFFTRINFFRHFEIYSIFIMEVHETMETYSGNNEPLLGVCQAHKSAKRGVCSNCNRCRKCEPLTACGNPGNHISITMGRRRLNAVNATSRVVRRRISTPTEPNVRNIELSNDLGDTGKDTYSVEYLQCSPLKKVFLILGIEQSLLDRIPAAGIRDMSRSSREIRRARQIVNLILLRTINELVQGENNRDKLKQYFQPSSHIESTSSENLLNALTDLSFFGNRVTSTICQSVLAKAMPRRELKAILNNAYLKQELARRESIASIRRTMGKVKFASLRQTYAIVASGQALPKHDYTYRVDATKISAVMQFLQSSLQVKPGLVRDVSIAGSIFRNMPVYERGAQTAEELFQAYKDAVAESLTVGNPTFKDIVKLLTKRGQTKAGLSTYFIRMRDMGNTFISMLHRVQFILKDIDDKTHVEYANQLIHEWKNIQQFVLWEYSNCHLKTSDKDAIHCCAYALGGKCIHEHDMQSSCCDKCSNVFTFFQVKVANFLRNQVFPFASDTSTRVEVDTMIAATGRLSEMTKHYIAHRLRAEVQFAAIHEIKNWLKLDRNSKILLVVDHKQKVLPMKYREGQVEYYGKTGMSVLGAMQVRWVNNNESTFGFEYKFYDFVVKGYSGQDNVQVCACIEQIVELIATKNADIREISVQSDNATCFASQELIPYIYHMNREAPHKAKIVKWIFTEAQTGRGRLDTHFSYVNTVLRSYVEDGHDINLEEDIVKALSHRGGIAGTHAVLLDATWLSGKALSKSFKARYTGSRETHEIQWCAEKVNIIKSSGITDPEIITSATLQLHKKQCLQVEITMEFNSTKQVLFIPKESRSGNIRPEASSSKTDTYREALNRCGMVENISREINEYSRMSYIPRECIHGWAMYPGNTGWKLSYYVLQKLNQLYLMGKDDKKRKVSADRALRIVLDEVVFDNWYEQLSVTVPKIKAFFSLSSLKQSKLLEAMSGDINNNAELNEFESFIFQSELKQVNSERIEEADTLQLT